jgi:hypothetical protein
MVCPNLLASTPRFTEHFAVHIYLQEFVDVALSDSRQIDIKPSA